MGKRGGGSPASGGGSPAAGGGKMERRRLRKVIRRGKKEEDMMVGRGYEELLIYLQLGIYSLKQFMYVLTFEF